MASRNALPALLLLLAAACGDTAEPALETAERPLASFLNGPDELPYLTRFQERFSIGVVDPVSDLRVIAGLPTVPGEFVGCQVFGPPFTGTEELQLQAIQMVGTEPPFLALVNTENVNIHVFRMSTFIGFCRSTIYAQGTGRLVSTDNDVTVSGDRTNIWGQHITGSVTMAETGEQARLNALVRFRARAGGPVEILVRKVELN